MIPPSMTFTDEQSYWFDDLAEHDNGYLHHHRWEPSNSDSTCAGVVLSPTFGTSAFDVFLRPDRSTQVCVRFVSLRNLVMNDATADEFATIEFPDLLAKPEVVLKRLTRLGFYIDPMGTAEGLAEVIRHAIDAKLFEARTSCENAAVEVARPFPAPQAVH